VRADGIAERLRPLYADVLVARDEVTLSVAREDLHHVLTSLRDDGELAFDFLSCVTATDWPERSPRYWVNYHLYSMAHKHRIRVKVGLSEEDPHVRSVTPLYPTADWLERETFDLYGIVFDGHPRLERILMPDGWEGHPLRKTEELGGVNTRFKGAFVPPVDRRTT
jgi:NADH-quinone oxidoreductase subunit C